MGLVAAGVNGIKLDENDEVVGMEILPGEGEIFMITSDGKAKRVEQKEFPMQGRYGKGVIAWDLPGKVRLAGAVLDKPNYMATIHLSKGAPKSTRLDAAGIRKRASTKGDLIVEVKPGEEVVSVNTAWTVDKFVEAVRQKPARSERKPQNGNDHKPAAARASANGKSRTASANGKKPVKKAAPKKPAAKAKAAKSSSPKKGKKAKGRK